MLSLGFTVIAIIGGAKSGKKKISYIQGQTSKL
jgi:hypothetical protein